MKKIFFLFVLLFTNLILHAQTGTVTLVPDATVYSNTEFSLGLSISCSGCSNFSINLNIGAFTYNSNNGTVYPAGVSVPQASGTSGIITVVINNSCQANQYINIPLKANVFNQPPNGPPNSQLISATISSCANMSVTNPNHAVSVTPINQNPSVNFLDFGSEVPAICRGARPNTYQIRVHNPAAGWLINTPSVSLDLPICAQDIVSTVTGFTITNYTTTKTVTWNLPSSINPNTYTYINVSFTLPCTSCTSFPLIVAPDIRFSGVRATYTPVGLLANTSAYLTTFNDLPSEVCNNNCTNGSTSGVSGVTMSFTDDPFHCPDGTPILASYVLGVGSAITSINHAQLTTNIPTQANITSVQLQVTAGTLTCAASGTQLSYTTVQNPNPILVSSSIVIGNVIPLTAPAGQKIDKLIWKFPVTCNVNSGTSLTFNYVYNYIPNPIIPPVDPISGEPMYNGGFECSANLVGIEYPNITNNAPFNYDYTFNANQHNYNTLFNCLPLNVINYFVRLKNTTNDFVSSLTVLPSSEVTYLIAIRANNLQNLVLKDILPSTLLNNTVGNFKFAYGTATNAYNPQNNLTFSAMANPSSITGTGMSTPAPQFDFNSVNNTLNITSINFPPNAQTLYITFDAQLSSSLIYNYSWVNSRFRLSQGNQSVYSSYTSVNVSQFQSVDTKMYARCVMPTLGEWQDNELKIRDTDKVDFKMTVKNTGSVPLSLKEIQNLKPMPSDKFVDAATISRGSNFKVDYLCNVTPTVQPSFTTSQACQINYSSSGPGKQRETVCPVPLTGVASVWSPTSCTQTNTNWIQFSYGNGITINPGDEISFIVRGQVSGASTSSTNDFAVNSFGVKLYYNNNYCPSPIEDTVKLINDGEGCDPPCINCASFALMKKEKYLISGWVREESKKGPDFQFKNYENSLIKLSFYDENGIQITTSSALEYFPSGKIIDGWQRIVGEFVVPATASGFVGNMKLELVNRSSEDFSFFDDIRILPSRGNMKSFVYDQKTQRLMAELDENNYSSFYEYDLEGGLIRIKKETEKGVFTIEESRSGNVKNAKP